MFDDHASLLVRKQSTIHSFWFTQIFFNCFWILMCCTITLPPTVKTWIAGKTHQWAGKC